RYRQTVYLDQGIYLLRRERTGVGDRLYEQWKHGCARDSVRLWSGSLRLCGHDHGDPYLPDGNPRHLYGGPGLHVRKRGVKTGLKDAGRLYSCVRSVVSAVELADAAGDVQSDLPLG